MPAEELTLDGFAGGGRADAMAPGLLPGAFQPNSVGSRFEL